MNKHSERPSGPFKRSYLRLETRPDNVFRVNREPRQPQFLSSAKNVFFMRVFLKATSGGGGGGGGVGGGGGG